MNKDFRIKNMSCDGKPIPDKYIACFNGYIKDVINKAFENELADLQHQLEVAEKAFDNLYDKFKVVAFEYAKMNTIPSKLHFKEQAESELKGE